MQMTVLGVKRMHGKSKAGNDFDMCAVRVLVAVETGARAQVIVEGYGFEEAEVMCDTKALPQFAGLKYPCLCELQTDQVHRMGKFETVVVGVKPVVAAAANRTGTAG